MPIITLTISINVPEGVTVDVKPEVTSTPKTATMPTIMFSEQPEYPDWKTASGTRWSEEEDEVAKDLDLSDTDVSELTGRSLNAVQHYRVTRGYRPPMRQRAVDYTAERAVARWTLSEQNYVLENYNGENAAEIAKALGRSIDAVRAKFSQLKKAEQS